MSKKGFKIGDIVKLNAGGPDMSVKSYRETVDIYVCQWFAGKKLEQGEFKPDGLQRVEPKSEDK
jgi:uncharacterized protein YodC (DUF2158 family)